MHFIHNFSSSYLGYVQELWLAVMIGFLISGFFNEFISTDLVKKYLGQEGIKPILISTIIGTLLPVCCFGSLPIVVTMQKKGARLGPTLAFLVATPATSVSALMVCWKLLGGLFTIYIFWSAIIIGLVMGVLGNKIKVDIKDSQPLCEAPDENCCHDKGCEVHPKSRSFFVRIQNAFRYAFITLPREIGLELLLGIAVASLIVAFDPLKNLIHQYLGGFFGYVFSLIFGLMTYVCSTASVPLADAFIKSGMGSGSAMVYLLVGPITSYGMIFVIKKKFGTKVLLLYLTVICVLSLLLGIGFGYLSRIIR